MNIREMVQSIVIHGFLGYLWVLFITHIVNVANSMDYMIARSLLILAGTLLFCGSLTGLLHFTVINLRTLPKSQVLSPLSWLSCCKCSDSLLYKPAGKSSKKETIAPDRLFGRLGDHTASRFRCHQWMPCRELLNFGDNERFIVSLERNVFRRIGASSG